MSSNKNPFRRTAYSNKTIQAPQPQEQSVSSNQNMILGSFEIESKLGVGSYATAYLATQKGTDRKAVVKIAHPHLLDGPHGEAIRKRFEIELRASTRVQHPNIITIYTAGELGNGTPAIAMEYVRGVSLEEWLEQNAPISSDLFNVVFHQLASALQALHDANIVHRDLSPRNMIINFKNTSALPHLTVLDFGIAQLDGITHMTAGPVGTPQFMAPEQLRGDTTKSSDVFALGQIMWWAMSGEPLLNDCKTQMEIFKYLANMKQAPSPTPEMRAFPPPIVEMLRRILSPDPLKRPSVDEVLATLATYTGLPGDSSEWFAVSHSSTGQFRIPEKAHLLILTHPEVPPFVEQDLLPSAMCDVVSAPHEQWALQMASMAASDVVLVPIPDDGARSRQIMSDLAQYIRTLPNKPKILAYRQGHALRGAWLSLGAQDVICLPEDLDRLRQHIRQVITTNAQKRPINVTAPETFNPNPLRRSLEENHTMTQELIETFIGHMPEWLLELEEYLEENNRQGILRVAGLLSSHAMSIGAERIVQICRTLCSFPSHYEMDHAMHWLEELEREYKKLFQELVSMRRR